MNTATRAIETKEKTVFETALGPCSMAWNSRGVTRVELLDSSKNAGADVSAEALPAWVEEAVRALQLHLQGNLQDLSRIPVDMNSFPPFFKRVYEIARTVSAGSTISYAELAKRAGSAKAVRAVGQAMAKNPVCLLIPCHRVLAKDGKLVGFSAPGGVTTKARLLELEAPLAQA